MGGGARGFPRWWGQSKCNLFVADAYNEGNKETIIPTGVLGSHPPTANDWFNGSNIPNGFTKTLTPQPGDVVASSTHVSIVSDESGKSISASTIENVVIENYWGFREKGEEVHFWHYEQ